MGIDFATGTRLQNHTDGAADVCRCPSGVETTADNPWPETVRSGRKVHTARTLASVQVVSAITQIIASSGSVYDYVARDDQQGHRYEVNGFDGSRRGGGRCSGDSKPSVHGQVERGMKRRYRAATHQRGRRRRRQSEGHDDRATRKEAYERAHRRRDRKEASNVEFPCICIAL